MISRFQKTTMIFAMAVILFSAAAAPEIFGTWNGLKGVCVKFAYDALAHPADCTCAECLL